MYGGIERVLAALIDELTTRGHQVTLFAHPDSSTAATLIAYGEPPHTGLRARTTELWQVASAMWAQRQQFDVVHSFGRLAALLPVLVDRSLPKIQSYQRAIPWAGVARAVRVAGDSLTFTACSDAMWRPYAKPLHGRWTTVFNGVDTSIYSSTVAIGDDAPLMFLGRLERIKGVHTAIAIARRANRRLIIAGNLVDSTEAREYFDRQIRPHVDNVRIRYVGPVDDRAKNELLGTSAALLMPIEWDEPFGIVMVEAMACGTPVIGFARGSVPEVVDEALTGFVVRDVDAAVEAVERLRTVSRETVRTQCERRFSYRVIATHYEQLYFDVVARAQQRLPRTG
jgi:glycosyltransferase involved in cell wall biosynthesis